MGYAVIERYRRQGFALEAIHGLARWASFVPGVTTLRLSISPTNVASLGLAVRLGMVQVGSHMDEIDGQELIFEGPLASHRDARQPSGRAPRAMSKT